MKITKEKLSKFISKYNLNGTNDAVKYVFDSKESTLTTTVYAPDKTLMGKIVASNVKCDEDLTIGVYETDRLKKLLGPMTEGELDITPVKSDDGTRVTSLLIVDQRADTDFVTADISAIPTVPNLKKVPLFGIEIEMSREFTNDFIKRKNSLENIETFTFLPDKTKKIILVLGYAVKINSNNVKLAVKTVVGKDELSKPITFSAKHLENIFKANEDVFVKDDSSMTLKVSEAGLAHVTIQVGDFYSEYYLTQIAQK